MVMLVSPVALFKLLGNVNLTPTLASFLSNLLHPRQIISLTLANQLFPLLSCERFVLHFQDYYKVEGKSFVSCYAQNCIHLVMLGLHALVFQL